MSTLSKSIGSDTGKKAYKRVLHRSPLANARHNLPFDCLKSALFAPSDVSKKYLEKIVCAEDPVDNVDKDVNNS